MIRKILLAVITAASTVVPVKAEPVKQNHNHLWDTLETVGVEMFVNEPDLCQGVWGGGKYIQLPTQGRSAIVICQDNGNGLGLGNFVTYTPNDLDTLRHEAHHVVQDCLGGVRADRDMDNLFTGDELDEFVRGTLPQNRIKWIIKTYTDEGASLETLLLELEAFAVANGVPADVIAEALKQACQIKT